MKGDIGRVEEEALIVATTVCHTNGYDEKTRLKMLATGLAKQVTALLEELIKAKEQSPQPHFPETLNDLFLRYSKEIPHRFRLKVNLLPTPQVEIHNKANYAPTYVIYEKDGLTLEQLIQEAIAYCKRQKEECREELKQFILPKMPITVIPSICDTCGRKGDVSCTDCVDFDKRI